MNRVIGITWLGGIAVCASALASPPALAHGPAQLPPAERSRAAEIKLAKAGISKMMNGDFAGATTVFRQVQKSYPESPLGYLLEADVNWWRIYLTRGNLIDPDVFESLSERLTPYDSDFDRLISLTIEKAEAGIRARQDEAFNDLCEGFAYALEARLAALRDHILATAHDGKKMRSLSLAALRLDPELADADLAVGIYNYFEATLPGYVRMLRFLIRLPKGDRAAGLQQLRLAAEKGQLVAGEAQFHLGKNLSRRIEQQYPKSLVIFRQMAQEYPDNPLWRLLVGSLELRTGQNASSEADYRQAIEMAGRLDPSIWQPLRDQAEQALARRHPAPTTSN